MSFLIGKEAPNFAATAVMADNSVEENFNLKEFLKGKKGLLFFYPLNFTFVCPSEILAFDKLLAEFKKRNTEIIGVSVDSEHAHIAYKARSVNEGGIGDIQYPLVSDLNKDIARSYDVLHDHKVALRGTFLIDEEFHIRHQVVNDLPLGRSVHEAIRMVDALAHHQQHGEVCPADWQKGEDAMVATNAGVKEYLSNKHSS
jgi:peroxiredoxin (alkyl hydroperoxide reductase subunit C)